MTLSTRKEAGVPALSEELEVGGGRNRYQKASMQVGVPLGSQLSIPDTEQTLHRGGKVLFLMRAWCVWHSSLKLSLLFNLCTFLVKQSS